MLAWAIHYSRCCSIVKRTIMEWIIIGLLIWIIVWQFIMNATVCQNQGLIIKKIDELWRKIDKMERE